jgi:hypothetical protein
MRKSPRNCLEFRRQKRPDGVACKV